MSVVGRIAALARHPVKGFTPEALARAVLTAGAHFPCDRLYAVEDGPSGFDPVAPAHLSKQKFTVLAKIAEVARARTAYDEATGVLRAEAEGRAPIAAALNTEQGRADFALWLTDLLGDAAQGPLRVLAAPAGHRFMDDVRGFVSVLNLNSVRDFAARIGRPVDPQRFRANIMVEDWPAWAELSAAAGASIVAGAVAGAARLRLVKPIVRCAATHVDPQTARRDLDLVPALFEVYGHRFCGIYAEVEAGGAVAVGDPMVLAA